MADAGEPEDGGRSSSVGPHCTAGGRPLFNFYSVEPPYSGIEVPPLAINATTLFFAINTYPSGGVGGGVGALMQMPLGGGTATEIAAAPATQTIETLALSSSLILYPFGDQVMAVPQSGGEIRPLATGTGLIQGLAVDSDVLYFSDDAGTKALALNGGAPQLLTTRTGSLAVNWETLFGVDAVSGAGGTFELWSLPKSGGQVTALARVDSWVSHLIPCGAGVCWIQGGAFQSNPPPQLMRLEPGGSPTALASSTFFLESLSMAFDGANFFVTAGGGAGEVTRIPQSGGTPTPIVMGNGGLAVDDWCLYWSDFDGIHSVLKTCDGSGCEGPPASGL